MSSIPIVAAESSGPSPVSSTRNTESSITPLHELDGGEFCDELRQEGYAEGRYDERVECMRIINWAYSKLSHLSFSKQEDALMLDEIKLMQMGAA